MLFYFMDNKYKEYLKSSEWAQLKIDLFNYRGYKCEKCGAKKSLHVHHKHYRNIYNEEPNDLIILCPKCHRKEHKIKVITTKHKPKKVKVKPIKYTFCKLKRKEEFNLKKNNPEKYKAYIKWIRKRL